MLEEQKQVEFLASCLASYGHGNFEQWLKLASIKGNMFFHHELNAEEKNIISTITEISKYEDIYRLLVYTPKLIRLSKIIHDKNLSFEVYKQVADVLKSVHARLLEFPDTPNEYLDDLYILHIKIMDISDPEMILLMNVVKNMFKEEIRQPPFYIHS